MLITDTQNPKLLAVTKTIVFLSTLWFLTSSFDLPNVNKRDFSGGKCIKAIENSVGKLCPPDSNVFVVVPEFKLADPNNYQIRTVVIDPGHGGHDPGCLGHNSREKHIVLSIGKHLAEGMRAQFPDVNVILTRSEDVFVPLHQRAALATDNKADLFISIHCNAFSKSSANGTETYVLGLHATKANLEVAKRENEAILLEDNYKENYGYDPNSPEAHIMFSMFQNAFLEQSIAFAEKVQGKASRHTGLKNRGVKQAGFLVLRHATMPSVLVEAGYLTNGGDEAFLMTDRGQQSMAIALLDAFSAYKREMEKTGPEGPATVSYIDKNTSAVVDDHPSLQPRQSIAESSKTHINDGIEEEVSKAKVWGLEIGPPADPVPTATKAEKTNVSPKSVVKPTPPVTHKKSSKILANVPVTKADEVKKAPVETVVATSEKVESVKKEGAVKKPATQKVIDLNPPKPEKTIVNPPIYKAKSADIQTVTKKKEPLSTQFCIQLAASPKTIDVSKGKWTRIGYTVEVLEEGSLYKYQVRNFATFEEANRIRTQLRAKGFNDAFVIAYQNGKRVDPRKLR